MTTLEAMSWILSEGKPRPCFIKVDTLRSFSFLRTSFREKQNHDINNSWHYKVWTWWYFLGYLAEQCECRHHFAGNSSFSQAHAFQILTPIANLALLYFMYQNFIPSKILYSNIISCSFIYNANGIFKLWAFYRSRPFAQAGDILVLQRANTAVIRHLLRRQLLLRWYLRQQSVRVRVMIGF